MSRILVLCCGGRDYADAQHVAGSLVLLEPHLGPWAMLQGGALGADRLCKEWAHRNGIPELQMDAHWGAYSKLAGPIRNGWMLEVCRPGYAVAFPGGAGTRDMVKRLQTAGVPVWQP